MYHSLSDSKGEKYTYIDHLKRLFQCLALSTLTINLCE